MLLSLGHSLLLTTPVYLSPHCTPWNYQDREALWGKMAGLQRSSQTFRRSGSSGLVWDERLMMSEGHGQRDQDVEGEALEPEPRELRHSRSVGSIGVQRLRHGSRGYSSSSSSCNNSIQAFHARRVPPAQDPPSPKVPGCIFCGIFRKAGVSRAI